MSCIILDFFFVSHWKDFFFFFRVVRDKKEICYFFFVSGEGIFFFMFDIFNNVFVLRMNPTEEKNTAKMCGLVVFSYHFFFLLDYYEKGF